MAQYGTLGPFVRYAELGAKGSLIVGEGAGARSEVTVGADDEVLVLDSGSTPAAVWQARSADIIYDGIAPGATNTFAITGVPATYPVMLLHFNARSTAGGQAVACDFICNSDGNNANYSYAAGGWGFLHSNAQGTSKALLEATGVGADAATTEAIRYWIQGHDTANTFTTFTHVLSGNRALAARVGVYASFSWTNAAVVTRFDATMTSGNFVADTRITLWGFR